MKGCEEILFFLVDMLAEQLILRRLVLATDPSGLGGKWTRGRTLFLKVG